MIYALLKGKEIHELYKLLREQNSHCKTDLYTKDFANTIHAI